MWLKSKFVTEVEEVARIGYIGSDLTKNWNANKKADELYAFTGFYWVEKRPGGKYRHGFKTWSMALSDAHQTLIAHNQAPLLANRRVRLVRAA